MSVSSFPAFILIVPIISLYVFGRSLFLLIKYESISKKYGIYNLVFGLLLLVESSYILAGLSVFIEMSNVRAINNDFSVLLHIKSLFYISTIISVFMFLIFLKSIFYLEEVYDDNLK